MRVHLPARLRLTNFDDLYGQLHHLPQSESLELHMERLAFAEPAGLLPLVCVLRNHVIAGGALTIRTFPQDSDVCGYLERINFYKLVGCPCPHEPGRRTHNDAFIEITEIGGTSSDRRVGNKLTSLLKGRVDVKNATGESFLSACGELVDNTRHAYNPAIEPQAKNWPLALILGQYYPESNTLHVTVADCGIGILRSLGAKDPEQTFDKDSEAIDRALVLGMKGTGSLGKGMGLAAIQRFMKQNGGIFAIRSGECLTTRSARRKKHRYRANWKGTVVSLEINGARNIDISCIIQKMAQEAGEHKRDT